MMPVETKRQIANAKDTVRRHKERLRRLSIIEKGQQSDFWKALAGEIDTSILANEAERDIILEAEHCTEDPVRDFIRVKSISRAIRSYKGIKSVVDEAAVKMVSTNEKIAEINKRIEQAESANQPGKGAIV